MIIISYKNINELQDKVFSLEKNIEEKENIIENLSITSEMLTRELKIYLNNESSLDTSMNSREADKRLNSETILSPRGIDKKLSFQSIMSPRGINKKLTLQNLTSSIGIDKDLSLENILNPLETDKELSIQPIMSSTGINKELSLETMTPGETEVDIQIQSNIFFCYQEDKNLNQVSLEDENLSDKIEEILETLKNNANNENIMQIKTIQELQKREQERCDQEKNYLVKELRTCLKKIVEIKLELEIEQEKYIDLQMTMSDEEKISKKKLDSFKKSLGQLQSMYNQLSYQTSMLKVEKKVSETKIIRITNKLKDLEKTVKSDQETITKLSQENLILNKQVEDLKRSKLRFDFESSIGQTIQIKKIIKGGGCHDMSAMRSDRRRHATEVIRH